LFKVLHRESVWVGRFTRIQSVVGWSPIKCFHCFLE